MFCSGLPPRFPTKSPTRSSLDGFVGGFPGLGPLLQMDAALSDEVLGAKVTHGISAVKHCKSWADLAGSTI